MHLIVLPLFGHNATLFSLINQLRPDRLHDVHVIDFLQKSQLKLARFSSAIPTMKSLEILISALDSENQRLTSLSMSIIPSLSLSDFFHRIPITHCIPGVFSF